MKITRAAENAVHAMVQVASAEVQVSLAADIAHDLEMETPYLAKILQGLARAGLLVSRQGRSGGFSLALPPGKVTLRMILEAVQGETALNRCLLRAGHCPNSNGCRLHRALAQAQDRLLGVFEQWTLADLMKQGRRPRMHRRVPDRSRKTG